ncbi:MAG: enoyl-CoA hydratase/isomerase family protein [Acetobacteraceae bacterium]|nr:enoyl-CoA hydratase/isomerase family protein [Acetobacteraceae bacterium]
MNEVVGSAVASGVLSVTLRRPEKRNALSRPLIAALADTFTQWRDRDDLSVAVLSGEGSKAFASGGDLHELNAVRTEADALAFARETRAALDTIRRFPVPVIAALNGDALGGGAELAMACDVRIAAPHARIGFLQGTLAIGSAWGGGTDLFRLLGSARALELLCGAEALTAERALALGLLQAVAPAEATFADAVSTYVGRFAARRPQVARAFKSLAIAHRDGQSSQEMAEIEVRAFAQTWVHPDHWTAADAVLHRIGKTG